MTSAFPSHCKILVGRNVAVHRSREGAEKEEGMERAVLGLLIEPALCRISLVLVAWACSNAPHHP